MEAGETVEITDRGRPVAILGPIPDAGPLERLRASGDLEPARHDLDDLPTPLERRGDVAPSGVLERLRSDER